MTPDELRALLAKATPGPWVRERHVNEGGETQGYGVALAYLPERVGRSCPSLTCGHLDDTDVALIVALRNHAEALLELWEAAQDYPRSVGTIGDARLCDALDRLEAT